jgi:hypothetical protein
VNSKKIPRRIVTNTLIIAASFFLAMVATAGVIHVGPNQSVKTIAEAAKLAKDGDIVEIAGGEYTGDVTTWLQKRLTIVGVGSRPVLNAAGENAEGKAIWVIRNGDFKISNIEFRGARATDGNGAGIRFEKGKLSVVNCAFFDNQNGLLTANFEDAELTIENSVFAQAPKQKKPLAHLLYVGRIKTLRVVNSRFHGGYFGHLLKSRAGVSDIRYSLLIDGADGSASYEADFPNGGDVTLVGNVLGQSSHAENPTMVAYGAEGRSWPINKLTMVHNTLYSEGFQPAWFLHVFSEKFPTPPEVMTRNNLMAGLGSFTFNVPGTHQGNFFAPPYIFGDTDIMDFTLTADSWLRGRVESIEIGEKNLPPVFEHLLPGRVSAIQTPSRWAPGAVQAPTLEKQ